MRHVDEGTIHAWLDEQITDPAEAAWIEEHLRGCGACRARLADEQATFDRAQALLAGSEPSGDRPSLEALMAKAGYGGGDSMTASRARVRHGRTERLLAQAGWAASIALAVALGWTARELAGRDTLRPDPAPAVEQSAATTTAPAERAEPSPPIAEPVTGPDVSTIPSAAAPVPQRPEAGSSSLAPATPTAVRETPRQATAAPPRAEARTQAESAAPESDRARSALTAEDTQAAAPPATATAPAAALEETITITRQAAPPADALIVAEWRALPRTEAAARTGMPLYGIDGVEPVLTALSANGALVRTTYRLASGDVVELVQQRTGPDIPPSAADVQSTRREFAGAGRGGVVANRIMSPGRAWSSVRDGVRVTLQTTSDATDLEALGTRLRID